MTASHLRAQLDRLAEERRCARRTPLARNALYMADLDAELRAAHDAYVGAVVTELASFRAALAGPQVG